jgi:hypothetical protein
VHSADAREGGDRDPAPRSRHLVLQGDAAKEGGDNRRGEEQVSASP